MRSTDSRWVAAKQRVADAWRELIAAWLDRLPDGGWQGSATALKAELGLLGELPWRGQITAVLRNEAAPVLKAKGWELKTHRTGRARLIVISRPGRPARPVVTVPGRICVQPDGRAFVTVLMTVLRSDFRTAHTVRQ